MDKDVAVNVTREMCRIAEETALPAALWALNFYCKPPALADLNYRISRFRFRVGKGRSTYMSMKGTADTWNCPYEHTITYGQKATESMLSADPGHAVYWRSAREILYSGFYGGVLTSSSLIAHTILHEVAHSIQRMTRFGDDFFNDKPHSDHFYNCLGVLHEKCGLEVLKAIEASFEKNGVKNHWQITSAELDLLKKGSLISYQMRDDQLPSYGIVTDVHKEVITVFFYSGPSKDKCFRKIPKPACRLQDPEDPKPTRNVINKVTQRYKKGDLVWIPIPFYRSNVASINKIRAQSWVPGIITAVRSGRYEVRTNDFGIHLTHRSLIKRREAELRFLYFCG